MSAELSKVTEEVLKTTVLVPVKDAGQLFNNLLELVQRQVGLHVIDDGGNHQVLAIVGVFEGGIDRTGPIVRAERDIRNLASEALFIFVPCVLKYGQPLIEGWNFDRAPGLASLLVELAERERLALVAHVGEWLVLGVELR